MKNVDTSLHSLRHFNKGHIFPSHFELMNVETSIQLFSVKTAAATVHIKVLAKEALNHIMVHQANSLVV